MTGNGQVNILLIGSSAQQAHALRGLLSADAQTYRLEHAGELEVGFARLSQQDVDLLLLDLSRLNGRGLEIFLRARRHALQLPIVVLVDAAEERLAKEAVEKGAQDYVITDRLDRDRLLQVLRSSLEQYRLAEAVERSTQQLQASELNFQHIIESNADGMVIVDQRGRVQFVNPAAEAMLGRSAHELLGTPFECAVETDHTTELPVVRKGQAARTLEIQFVDTLWEGQPAFLASLRDISERKRLEHLKDEFVSKVSHELRTPLTSIKGTVTLMLNGALGPTNAEQQDFLQTVNQDIDRLAGLINNLLDLSKIEAGKMVMTRQRMDLAGLIDPLCRSYHTILGKRTVVRQFSPVPQVYADPNLILQVIANLVGNAVKFTADTGTITFIVRMEGDQVALTVQDDGPGIPKESVGKLFQKFVQADLPAENQPKGTGLGLAISREIVEMHRGEIRVESEVGHGTAFTFRLPAYDPVKELDQLFEGARASGGEVTLLAVELAGEAPDALVTELEHAVRANVSRNDHVLLLEPALVVVLAATDQRGAEAMRQRLLTQCADWLKKQTAEVQTTSRVRMASATAPMDGDRVAGLVQRAKEALR